MSLIAHRGELIHFPDTVDFTGSVEGDTGAVHFEDGLLLVEDGYIAGCGAYSLISAQLHDDTRIVHHTDGLIIPGMVDTHVHYPQTEIIASYGTQLIDWLNQYTFPAEGRFSDPQYAAGEAAFFLDQLIGNGTTTALVFGTVHAASVDAFFTEAARRNLRMICGKVMMDRNAPDYLCDTPQSAYDDSRELIKRWHGHHRLGYAVTPRFAPTSTDQQLAVAGQLLEQHPDVYLHTHLAENTAECQWVNELFPERAGYLDVYDHYELLGKRSVFAHGIHLQDTEWRRLAETRSSIAHCPTSNLFIGSGLYSLARADEFGVKTALGTDVGGGDSFSLLRTINEAYKVQQLQGANLSPLRSLYMATLGGARSLDLDRYIGNFEPGKEADFVVLDYAATSLIAHRINAARSLQEKLFVMQMLGDDRAVRETWIMGARQEHGKP